MSSPVIKVFLLAIVFFWALDGKAQGVGIGVEDPNPNAVLELVSPGNNQGLLVPKMTTAQRTSNSFTSNLTMEENGLLVYDTDENAFYFWMNSGWVGMQMNISLVAGDGIEIVDGEISNIGDLDPENEIQNLELTGNTLIITGNTSATPIDLSGYVDTNTDEQDLGFDGSNLTITSGASVDVSGWDLDVTDDFSGDYNDLLNQPTLFSGNFSDLTGVPTNLDTDASDDFSGDYNDLLNVPGDLADGDDVNDADFNPTNEIQDLSLLGNTLTITGNASATPIDLSPFAGTNTDEQDLGFDGSNLTITSGASVDVSGWDLDASNDFSGDYNDLLNQPTLFSGNFSDLAGVPANLDTDASDDFSGDYNDLLNQPTLFSGNFSDLAGVPANLDTDASDDFSGDYNDLLNVPADLADGDDVNDADFNPTNEIQDLSLLGNTLTITGNASATPIDLSPFAGTNTDEQDLGFDGSNLTITSGTSVDVSGWDLDASDDFSGDYNDLLNQPTLFSGNFSDLAGVPANLDTDASDDFSGDYNDLLNVPADLADGDDVNDADFNPTNEIQDLSLLGNTLTITGNASATPIDLSPFAGTNTDEQDLGFDGSNLTITSGTSVDVSGWDLDASDDFSGDYNDLLNQPTLFSGNFSDLAGVPANLDTDASDDFSGDYNDLLNVPADLADGDDVNDADFNPTNEIQDLSLLGNTLTITGNASATPIDLSPFAGTNTDEQDLGFDGSNLTITSGTSVDVSGWDLDASDDFSGDYNDLLNQPTLFSGNFSDLAGVPANLDTDASDDFSGDYNDLLNQPTLFSGNFSDLAGVPANLDTDASDDFSGDYNDLLNQPTLFSGNFSDLAGVPANLDTDASDDFSGDYNDLLNQPTLFSGNFSDLTGVPANLDTDASDDFSGDYNDLLNQPTLFSGNFSDLAGVPC